MQLDKSLFNLKDIKMGFFGKMMLFTILYGLILKFVVPFETFHPGAWAASVPVWIIGLFFIACNE